MFTLAQSEPAALPSRSSGVDLRQLQQHFSGDSMIPLQWVVLAAGLVLIVVSGLSLHRWWKTRHLRSNPMLVYYQVGAKLGLGLSDLWLLLRIARREHLPTPLTLVMSPATLRHHAERYAEPFSPDRARAIQRHVERIARKVFGGGAAATP